jgi:hypothetical protein
MGVQNFVGQLAYLVAPWFLWFMQLETWFDDMIDGAGRPRDHHRSRFDCRRNHAGIFLRERFSDIAVTESRGERASSQTGSAPSFCETSRASPSAS